MSKKIFTLLACILICASDVSAQEWLKIHHNYAGMDWSVPFELNKYKQWDFSAGKTFINATAILPDGSEMSVPYSVADIDSIDFAYDLTDEEKGHNKYRPFTMHITTEGYANIVEKEVWLNCHISIDGKGEYSNFSGTGRIRGRGNSTWEWYEKKPYKFKLDEKSKLLGLDKAKNWNLLANWRDVTDLMNVYAFEAARYMGMPNTNHSRFVEVFLNDDYIGTYQLTEKIEVGKNRVNIDETDGVMLSFDQDDGPQLSPYATDNFWSSVFKLPMCVKHPEDPDAATIEKAKADFAELENAIKSHNYNLVESLMDIHSFISILQLHELIYNVEIDAPRSIYMYRDKGGKYVFGPVWDGDAGYDFDWSDMYTGHTFFGNYQKLIYGTDPLKATGANYNINKFWREMFGNKTFVKQYKEAWKAVSDSIYNKCWAETYKYAEAMTAENTYWRDTQRWPLEKISGSWWNPTTTTFKPAEEISKMSKWLKNRKKTLDTVIANYPAGTDEVIDITDPDKTKIVKILEVSASCKYTSGYDQSDVISISQSEIENLLGGEPTDLIPLNADGSEGKNTAAGTFGAWFDDKGTQEWGSGAHIYIESNDLYIWGYGCHPDNCGKNHTHIVTMQYRRGSKAVNVKVTFTLK